MNTKSLSLTLVSGLCAGMPTPAAAQASFTNGGFSSGLSGWTVVNTSNGTGAPGSALPIDIDGPGPLAVSDAARFAAGQATFQSGVQHGVSMTQGLSLTGGITYVVDFDWSAQKLSGASTSDGGTFSLIVNGAIMSQASAGTTGVGQPRFGHFTGSLTPSSSGPISVGVRVTRAFLPETDLFQYVDNVTISAVLAAIPLGAIPVGSTTVNGTLTANQVRWYSLTIPDIVSPAYLDIDTEGSALTPSNNTELGLYNSSGVLVATDDDDGTNFLSQLTFGNTTPRPAPANGLLYDGRDGPLSAGTYFLAVGGFNSTFGATNWNAASSSSNTGNFRLNLVRGNTVPTGGCCAPAGTCSITSQTACAASGGIYRGDGTSCAEPCPQPGACCLPTGGCSILTNAECAAAGGAYAGDGSTCATANCPIVLFNAGRACTVMLNGSRAFVGFSSGSLPSQGFPNRWSAQAFTLPQVSRVKGINVEGLAQPGSEFTTMNYIVWRRTGTSRPLEGDQVATGSMPLPAEFPNSRIRRLPVDFILTAGDYYLTIHASGEVNPGGDANFLWLGNAQLDPAQPGGPNTPIVISDAQGVFMWRSQTMPAPGFQPFTSPTLEIDPTPAFGPNPQNPDYLYNTGFTILGHVLPNTCYPNCDGSTGSPRLTSNDFQCFINAFAGGQTYANCDGSTGTPALTSNDFQCFINAFAAGCT